MLQIKSVDLNKNIQDEFAYNFNTDSDGIFGILITAKCKNWLQNIKKLFNDDDLAIQIDSTLFAELKGKKREFTTAGSWNGNELKNQVKTCLYILPLNAGDHTIKFYTDESPFLEKLIIYEFSEPSFDLTKLQNSYNFFDVIIKDVILENIEISATCDLTSNLQVKIDGSVQENNLQKKFKHWYWYGKELNGQLKSYVAPTNLEAQQHSIELVGEGSPKVSSFTIKIGRQYKRGTIKLYKDIVIRDAVNLRPEATDDTDIILAEMRDGESVEILEERVVGKYILNMSEIWHKIIYKEQTGFVLSSYVEIEGQERAVVIELIKNACQKYNADPNLMLAIAGRESHFKPFAVSSAGPKGIFQLSQKASEDVGVTDQFNIFQNVDGGVQYFKKIESLISGHGDILEKRLAAWYDGLTKIEEKIRNKTYKYENLSTATKTFIVNVKENSKKRNWFNILNITLIFFLLIGGTTLLNVKFETNVILSQATSIVEYPLLKLSLADYMDEYGKPALPKPYIEFNKEKQSLIFNTSQKKIAAEVDTNLLKLVQLNNLSSEDTFVIQNLKIKNQLDIGSAVLNYPKNIFYS